MRAYSADLAILAGIAIIIMGLHFLGVTPIAWLMREKRFEVAKPVSLWGAYVMGLAFALGWTPCIGPILAAILAIAASEATVAKGAGMLAVYSLGLGVPFMIAALAVEPFAAFLARFRAHLGLVEKVMGGLLVLTGIAFLTGTVSEASYWLLDMFPTLGKSDNRTRSYIGIPSTCPGWTPSWSMRRVSSRAILRVAALMAFGKIKSGCFIVCCQSGHVRITRTL